MIFFKIRYILVINLFLVLNCVVFIFAQNKTETLPAPTPKVRKDWILFLPPNKSFTIELAEIPLQEKSVTSIKAENSDANLTFFKCTKSINYYRLPSLFNAKKYRLVIQELDISDCKRKKEDFSIEFSAYIKNILGENLQRLSSDKEVEINEIRGGREIRYESGSFYEGTTDSPIYNKILAVNAGKRIFIATYYRGEGSIGEESDIFQTFRPKFEKNPLIIDVRPKIQPIPINKEKWTIFSPNDKSFTVELPESPKEETKVVTLDRENETDINLYLFRCTKSVTSYSLPSLKEPNHHQISIFVTDVSGCKRKKNEFYDEINGLFSFIGGDNRKALSDKMVKVNGLRGREIVYKNGSEIYGRTPAVNAGKKIIFLTYNRLNGDLSEEVRIFSTFKPKKMK